MARISTYPIISTPTLNDLLIGTDVDDLNITKNFSLGDVATLISNDFVPYVGATGNVNLGAFSIEASSFIVDGGLASQFVKANGSLDSTVYTPQTRTLTINSVTFDLSANRSWDLNTIDTLTTTGTSGAATYIGKTLNIPQYQAQGNYITQLSGEATAMGPGNATVTLSNLAVISKVLTGLNITGGTVVDTDSILTAFGKVQNQINGLAGGVTYEGTWNAATNVPFLQSSVGVQGHYYVVNVAGTTNLNGITDWQLGDWAIFNGSVWEKVDNTDAVVSVNGYTGAVVLTFSDVGAPPATRNLTINGVQFDLTADRTWTVGDVRTDQSYANPTWITSLAWSKITGTPTTLAGYGITDGVSSSRTLTINGVTYDLTADRSWSVGTVTSVGTSGPLTGGTITGSGTIGITQSGASSDGYLSSTDWNTFNNKQNALTNPVTGTGTIFTLPMWSGATSLVDSPLSYGPDTFNFQYNSATGGTVNFTNIGLTAYTYSIQMNNFGSPRSTVHSYTDGVVVQSIAGTQVSRLFANGNFILGDGVVDNGHKLSVEGNVYIETIANAVTDTDKFIVSDGGVIKYRTGAEVLSDIGAQGSITLTTTGTTGPATLIGDTLNIPNYTTDLTGYVPYTGATQSVDLGAYNLSSNNLIANGGVNSGALLLKQSLNSSVINLGYTTITPSSAYLLRFGFSTSLGIWKAFRLNVFSLTDNTERVYTMPNADGTLALTSDIPSLAGYVTLATDQTITGLKTIMRVGAAIDVLNFKIDTSNIYALKVAYNQNELAPSGEATWSLVNTFNNGSGTGLTTTPISFFRGVLVTGERLLSASVNSNLLDYYGNNPAGRYPIYAYNTGVQQFASSIIVGETTGVVNAVTGAIADLPAGVVANFKGRVIGSNAVNNNEFATLGQVTSGSRAAISLTTTGTSGPATYSSVTGVLNIPQYQAAGTYVTAVTASSPLASSGGTTPNITIQQASGSQSGFLSSTDWTTFNNKQNALTNPVTGTGTTNYLPKFTGSTTIGNSQIFDNGSGVGINTATPYTATNFTFVTTNNTSGSGYVTRVNGTLSALIYSSASATIISEQRALPLIFETNGTSQLTLNSSGNLGIGNTPSDAFTGYRLQVGSISDSQTFISIGNSTSGLGPLNGLVIGNDSTGADIYQRENLPLRFHTSNAVKMNLTSSGRLLIGSPPPTESTFQLDVNGTGRFSGNGFFGNATAFAGLAGGISVNGSTNSGINFRIADVLRGYVYVAGNLGMYVESTAGNVVLAPTGVSVLTATTNGNVWIGNDTNPILEIANGGSTDVLSGIRWSVGGSRVDYGGIYSATSSANNNYISFYTKNSASAPSERMRITSVGNVGIGVVPSSWQTGRIALQIGTYTSLHDVAGFTIFGNNTYNPSVNRYLNNGAASQYYQESGSHIFETAPSGTAGNAITFTPQMKITVGGNVLIGTTTDGGDKFQVSGTIFQSNYTYHGNNAAGNLNGAAIINTSITLTATNLITYEVYTLGNENGRNQAVRVYFVYYNTAFGWSTRLVSTTIETLGNDYGVVTLLVSAGGVLQVQAGNLISTGSYRVVVMNQFKN